jgi:hypothetical protein
MTDFETAIQEAVDAKEIPGCVLYASNRDGDVPSMCIIPLLIKLRLIQLHQNLRHHIHGIRKRQTPADK